MLTGARLGLSLALDRRASSWSRRLLIALAAAVVAGLSLAAGSVQVMLDKEQARVIARTPIVDEDRTSGPVRVRDQLDFVDGEQFEVRWLELSLGSALPPGVGPPDVQGARFLISPALAEALDRSGSLRFRPHGILSAEALQNRDEVFAYALLPESSALGAAGSTVVGYGAGINSEREVELPPLVAGVLAFLIVPGISLLIVAQATRSVHYVYRCQLLRRIGVSRTQIAVLGAVEAALPVLFGFGIGAGLHRLLIVHVGRVPIIDRRPSPGDLLLDPSTYAGIGGVVVIIGAAIGAGLAVRRSRPSARTRPRSTDAAPHEARIVPLAAGSALMVGGMVQAPSPSSRYLLLLGSLLTIVGIPLVLPVVAGIAGGSFARRDGLTVWMLGRRMEHDPQGVMRPLLAAGGAITLLLILMGYLSVVRFDDEPPRPAVPLSTALVSYVPEATSPPASGSSAATGLFPADLDTGLIDASCDDLSPFLQDLGPACNGDGTLSSSGRAGLALSLGIPPQSQGRLRLGPVVPAPGARTRGLLAISRDPSNFAERVRGLVSDRVAPEVTVRSEVSQGVESPLVGWLLLGMTVAGVTSFLALTMLTVERYARSVGDHRVLGILGLPAHAHWRLETAQFAVTTLLTTVISYSIGLAGAFLMTTAASVSLPLASLLGATILIILGVLLSVVAIGAISYWKTTREATYAQESGQARWTT